MSTGHSAKQGASGSEKARLLINQCFNSATVQEPLSPAASLGHSSWASESTSFSIFFLNKQTSLTFGPIPTLPLHKIMDLKIVCVTPLYHHAWKTIAISVNNSRTTCFTVNYFLEFSWYAGKLVIVYFFSMSISVNDLPCSVNKSQTTKIALHFPEVPCSDKLQLRSNTGLSSVMH